MILNLGKQFNLSIVAEGIETEYQQQWLSNAGCDVAQGYFFARPMPIDVLVEWLTIQNK